MGNGSSNPGHPGGSIGAYQEYATASPYPHTSQLKATNANRQREIEETKKRKIEERMNSMIEELKQNGYQCTKTTGGKRRVKKRATRKRKTRA
jgi:hypothetical protein